MVQGQRSAGFSINGPISRIKAEKLTEKELWHKNYMFHSQWLNCFKNFCNIVCVKVGGEAVSADSKMAVYH
jgi:hypothetical protein